MSIDYIISMRYEMKVGVIVVIINRKKNIEEYKFKQMPKFSHKRLAIAWCHAEEMNAELLNIKSIDIEVKDIKQMVYSSRTRLFFLYSHLNLKEYNDNDYINISKYKEGNGAFIFEILNTSWILKLEDLENKSNEELEYDIFSLQSKIEDAKKKITPSNMHHLANDIKLLEYKLSGLEDYKCQRMSSEQANKMVLKKTLTVN